MKEKRILRIEDLLELIPVSRATFDRWIREARQGINDFPLPFTRQGRRCLWDSHVIEEWIANRHRAGSPNIPPVKSERQKVQEYIGRQQRAKATLERHGIKKEGMELQVEPENTSKTRLRNEKTGR